MMRSMCRLARVSPILLGKPYEEIPQVAPEDLPQTQEDFISIIPRFKAWSDKYGDTFRAPLFFAPGEGVFVSKPENFEKAFRNEGKFPSFLPPNNVLGEWFRRNEPYASRNLDFIINLNGEQWAESRKPIQRHLLSPGAINHITPPILEVGTDLVRWVKQYRGADNVLTGGGNAQDFNVQDMAFYYAFEAVNYALYGIRLGMLSDNPPQACRDYIYGARQLFLEAGQTLVDPGWQNGGTTPAFEQMSSTMKKTMAASEVFIQQAKEYYGSTENMPECVLKDQLTDPNLDDIQRSLNLTILMLAGVDTTSNSLMWLLHNLVMHQDKQDKLRAELESLPNKDLTLEDLAGVPYLKACQHESMRVTPTLSGNLRRMPEEIEMDGYDLPAGTHVLMMKMISARKDKVWENAEEFYPEQWVNFSRSDEIRAKMASTPFGQGPRMCPGMRLARLELLVAAANLVKNFKMTPAPDYQQPTPFFGGGILIPMPPPKIVFNSV